MLVYHHPTPDDLRNLKSLRRYLRNVFRDYPHMRISAERRTYKQEDGYVLYVNCNKTFINVTVDTNTQVIEGEHNITIINRKVYVSLPKMPTYTVQISVI